MLSKQIQFYNNLSDEQKYIVHLFALISGEIEIYTGRKYIPTDKKITEKLFKQTINACADEGILQQALSFRQYSINPEFMVWIFPSIENMQKEWEYLSTGYISYYSSPIIRLRNYLYALLFDEAELVKQELNLQPYIDQIFPFLTPFFIRPEYEPVLYLVDPTLLEKVGGVLVEDAIGNLNNLNIFEKEKFKKYFGDLSLKEVFLGNFDNGLKLLDSQTPPCFQFFIEASRQMLKENDSALAMSLFDKGMKKQRGWIRNAQIPLRSEYALYFLTALQAQPSEVSALTIQKIIDSLAKRNFMRTDTFFGIMCQYLKNNRDVIKKEFTRLQQLIPSSDEQYYSFWAIVTLYFIGEKPHDNLQRDALGVVEKHTATVI